MGEKQEGGKRGDSQGCSDADFRSVDPDPYVELRQRREAPARLRVTGSKSQEK